MSAKDLQPLKNLLALLIDGLNDAIIIEKSGKPVVEQLGVLSNLIPDLLTVVSSVGQIPSSLDGFDSEDGKALVAYVVAKLSVQDAHAQAVINKALLAAASVYELILAIKNPPQGATAPTTGV